MRRTSFVAATLVAVFSSLLAVAEEPSVFIKTEGFATKTGFRGNFAWQASQPVLGVVHYGTNAGNLSLTVLQFPAGIPDTAGMAIVDGLAIGSTYYWQVEDAITGEFSELKSFKAANAYTDWDGQTYTIDLTVQIDSQSLPPDVPHDMALTNAAQGISIFAERFYDAMDGYARLGKIIVTDTDLEYSANIPFQPVACLGGRTNAADVLIQTTVPFDSHTFSGWAISNPCTAFYVGRLGQLVIPWGSTSAEDLHFGYVSTHEMLHYAMNAPDLYPTTNTDGSYAQGCANLAWDGSLMHNGGGWKGSRWELTELDRNSTTTPCLHTNSTSWTWPRLRERYTNVPEAPTTGAVGNGVGHIMDSAARGNDDGGALDIIILDQTPGLSTLTSFTPSDAVDTFLTNPCVAPGATVLLDASGDATTQLPAHDVQSLSISQLPELGADKIQFVLKVAGLQVVPPNSAWPVIFKDAGGLDRFVRMSSDALGVVTFATGSGTSTNPNLTPGVPADPASSYDPDGTIRIIVAGGQLGSPASGGVFTQFLTRILIPLPAAVTVPVANLTTSGVTPDNMPNSLARSSGYTVIDPAFC